MSNENDNILKFKNYKHKEKVPFVVYADIESLLKPIITTHIHNRLIKSMSLQVLHIIYNVILMILSVKFISIAGKTAFNGLSISCKV